MNLKFTLTLTAKVKDSDGDYYKKNEPEAFEALISSEESTLSIETIHPDAETDVDWTAHDPNDDKEDDE